MLPFDQGLYCNTPIITFAHLQTGAKNTLVIRNILKKLIKKERQTT